MESAELPAAWLESDTGARTPVKGNCRLGRSAACEVVVPDVRASRQHALVHGPEEGAYWLVDLGSNNGTLHNGRRISQPSRLAHGDKITVADAAFTFHFPSAAPAAAAPTVSDVTVHDVRSQECWLLLADIEGSTGFLRAVPREEAPHITGRWLSTCAGIVERYLGTVNKFLGDGLLGYWPRGNGSDRAVAGALTALKTLQGTTDLPFRVVLHYGQVWMGGPATRGEESLTGQEVNFVFRMEKVAAVQGVSLFVSEAAQSRLGTLLPLQLQGTHAVADFPGEFRFFTF